MICAVYGCTSPAEYPFACCGKQHGYDLKQILNAIEKEGELVQGKISIATESFVRHMIRDELDHRPPEEIQHYRDFINRNEPHGTQEGTVQPNV